MTLERESERASELLAGLKVTRVVRRREQEVVVELEGGWQFRVDSQAALELAIFSSED